MDPAPEPLSVPYEPPTEPFIPQDKRAPDLMRSDPFSGPAEPPPPPSSPTPAHAAFAHTRYRFTTGLRAGETAAIRADDDRVLLSYRSFATVVGVVAALISAIVIVAGLAAVVFLLTDGSPLRASVALVLTFTFAYLITLLVPRVQVTLYDDHHPALTISQRSVFPTATYVVAAPNGAALAELRKTFFSRIGRNRWTVAQQGRFVGDAVEESFARALVRKFLGKFSRRFETDFVVRHGGVEVGRIRRTSGDVLEIENDALDRRVAVALATLVLGREP